MKRMFLLAITLCACSRGPSHSTTVYVDQLQPLLVENSTLATLLLESAADVYNGRSSAGTLALTWETEIVPIATHLHLQSKLVQPPAEWIAEHAELVDLWGDRARGYQTLSIAVDEGDEAKWKRGKGLADQAKLDEEKWFIKVNGRLEAESVQLDQFP